MHHWSAARVMPESLARLRTERLGSVSEREAATLLSDGAGDEGAGVLELMSRGRRTEILDLRPAKVGECYRPLLAYPRTAIGRYVTRRAAGAYCRDDRRQLTSAVAHAARNS